MPTANTHNDQPVFTFEELARFETEAGGKRSDFRVTVFNSLKGERMLFGFENAYTAEQALRYSQAQAEDLEGIHGKMFTYAACNCSDWQAEVK